MDTIRRKKLQISGIPEGERSRKPIKEIIAENLRTGEFPKSEEKFGNSLVKLRIVFKTCHNKTVEDSL